MSVLGLAAQINVRNVEVANDSLVINGQGGDDNITATTLPAGIAKLTIDGGAGDDRIFGSQAADTLIGGDGDDFLSGWVGEDQLDGGNGNDVLSGLGDNDTLKGGAGNDELWGEAGEDLLIGGTGDDTYFVEDFDDTIQEAANGGTDTIATFVDISLGANIENASAVGGGATPLKKLAKLEREPVLMRELTAEQHAELQR